MKFFIIYFLLYISIFANNNYEQKINTLYLISSLCLLLLVLIFGILVFRNNEIYRLVTDSLTELPNRKAFLEMIKKNKSKKGFAILINIDKFKDINKRYGYDKGDEFLISLAKVLMLSFSNRNIYRTSSNEFSIFFKGQDIDSHLKKVQNSFYENHLNYLDLSLNIGYYYRDNLDIPLSDAFTYAEIALHEVKNRDDIFTLMASEKLIEYKNREKYILELFKRNSLENLYPAFQPKFEISSKKVVGGEALARWNDPKLGFLSPGEFIPIGESIKLVHLIDYKIAEESIKTLKEWLDRDLISKDFTLSFNLSMETFDREETVPYLIDLLKRYNISGKFFEIEITETILSNNINKTLKKLFQLKELGFKISIDDFTVGHSTASFLNCIPADIIKFDKSILDFIQEDNIKNHSIYKSLIQLVKNLNLIIVAEGIETEYQLKFLQDEKVHIGQGFLFSKPIPKKEFELFFNNKI